MNPSVKVAQPGWSVATAPDWALVFSSDWPSLQIAFETTVSGYYNSPHSPIAHNLGYFPLTMAWITHNGLGYGRVSNGIITITNNDLFISQIVNAGDEILIRCYNVDVSTDASYPLPIGAAAKTSPDLSTYIRIVKTNRNISSTNLNDFILNSRAQSPAVLDVATQAGPYFANGAITYPLQTSFIPWVAGAYMTSNNPTTYTFFSINDMSFVNNSLVVQQNTYHGTSLVVLRDPLFYPNTVRLVY